MRSLVYPSAGLAVIPEKPSLPPHSVPTMSSLTEHSVRSCACASCSSCFAIATPRAIVSVVPPDS